MVERFSASKAGRLMSCHASANLEKAIPGWQPPEETDTRASSAGTAVHELIHKLIEVKTVTPSKTTKFNARDMLAVAEILQYTGELWRQRRFKVLSEVPMKAQWLKQPTTTTADLVFHTQDQLEIIDFKWGTIPVAAVENEQLLFYAATYAHLAPKAEGVMVHILQPRADNMESWWVSADRLEQFIQDALQAEQAIREGDVEFGPSDHCLFCPANPRTRGARGKPLCPALMEIYYPNTREDTDAMLEGL